MDTIHDEVKKYYGETLQSNEDLKTNACCTVDAPPRYIKTILSKIHDEVHAKYYGCGLTIPHALEEMSVLDLGSGSGRDCFIASALVGDKGSVIGIDMTDEQLEVANKYVDFHSEAFGYSKANTTFLKGNIDALQNLNLASNSVDVVISNCVINLCTNKSNVLKEVFRILKPGGEMYFSDVYADRRIPKGLQDNHVLWGECLSGALYWNDFIKLAKQNGFIDPRVVDSRPISVENEALQSLLGDIRFYSVTYRLFKISDLEPDCEDYGQAVSYKGSILNVPNSFKLDDHHLFPKGKIVSVCGNTYRMLSETRFSAHFEFYGSWDTHYGIFEGCGTNMPYDENFNGDVGSCC